MVNFDYSHLVWICHFVLINTGLIAAGQDAATGTAFYHHRLLTVLGIRTGPPFRGSAIPGVRVRVRVNPSGPLEWRTGILGILSII